MQTAGIFRKQWFRRGALAATALGGFLFFAGALPAWAHDWEECQRRIDRAEWKLEEAIKRHGYYSRQANHWRHELREQRERCWREQERWRHGHRYRWHRDHDWDDDD